MKQLTTIEIKNILDEAPKDSYWYSPQEIDLLSAYYTEDKLRHYIPLEGSWYDGDCEYSLDGLSFYKLTDLQELLESRLDSVQTSVEDIYKSADTLHKKYVKEGHVGAFIDHLIDAGLCTLEELHEFTGRLIEGEKK